MSDGNENEIAEAIENAENGAPSEELSPAICETPVLDNYIRKNTKKKKIIKEISGWTITILLAFLLAVFINTYLIRVSAVVGPSMQNTYFQGDRVTISRMPYILGEPDYGDVIVFASDLKERTFIKDFSESLKYNVITQSLFKNTADDRYWIKRIVGLPGDTMLFANNIVYRNGVPIDEPYVSDDEQVIYFNQIITVEEGCVFVMGDNRNHSSDSRLIGCVPINSILGKVVSETE